MAGPDFYNILGVSRTASADEIKLAHRELVKKYHPDLFPTGTEKTRANRKLQQINEAYRILSNPERRQQYDARFAQRTRSVKAPASATKSGSTASARRRSAVTDWQNLAGWATEKLPKACRNLANAGRAYYTGLSQKVSAVKRAAAASQRTSLSGRSHPSAALIWRNLARRYTERISVKATAGILGILIVAWILKTVWKDPEIAVTWTLLENTAVEPTQTDSRPKSGERNWSALGYHSSKEQCAASLKQRVLMDEKGGSKVFLDESSGTIGMTIYWKSEAALAEEYLHEKLKQRSPPDVDPQVLEQQAREEAQEFIRKNGITRRVKHYQCREIQVVRRESWLRSKLRRLGLVS
jgi:curved DNA-binding protein CbpA